VHFTVGDRAMLDPARHDKKLPRAQRDGPVPHLNTEITRDNQEEFVGIGVRVPDKLSGELDHLDLVIIQSRNNLGRPRIGEQSELCIQIDDIPGSHNPIIAAPPLATARVTKRTIGPALATRTHTVHRTGAGVQRGQPSNSGSSAPPIVAGEVDALRAFGDSRVHAIPHVRPRDRLAVCDAFERCLSDV
jgi:hypothetical protein